MPVQSKILAKRLFKGSSLRVILLGCNIVVSFFMMPFLINSIGDRWYGFWVLIGTFMGYYGFLDLGLSTAITRYISKAYGQKDDNEVNIVLNTSLFLFCIVSLVAMLITIVVSFFCSYFINQPEDIYLFRIVILVLGLDVSISFPMRVFAGVLTSKIRYDLLEYVELVKLISRAFLIYLFIKAGYGIFSLALITMVINFAGYLLSFFFVRKECPDIRFGYLFVYKNRIKKLLNYSKYTFIAQLADKLRFKVDVFVIASFIDMSKVTVYFIAAKIIEYFVQLIISSLGILTPVFSQYEAKGDFVSLKRLFLSSTTLSATITFFVGGSILYYGKYFISVWMGPNYNNSYYVVVILCSATMFGLMQNPSIGLLYGISKHKYYAISNTGEGIINLILSIILVQYYGIYGVALGTLIGMIIFKLFIQPIYVSKVIELSMIKYYKTMLMPLAKLSIPMTVFFCFAEKFMDYSYFHILIIATVQILVFLPILYFFILGVEERNFFRLVISKSVLSHK